MPDDRLEGQVYRLEQRVEDLTKAQRQFEERVERDLERDLERVERGMREQFASLKEFLQSGITAALAAQDARQAALLAEERTKRVALDSRNELVRYIVIGFCAMILTAFANWWIGERFTGTKTNLVPTLPPTHSSKEMRQ